MCDMNDTIKGKSVLQEINDPTQFKKDAESKMGGFAKTKQSCLVTEK